MQALRFITCGSVDDGKSTLIGRLLVDTQAVLQDQLAGVQRQGQTDLALLTDGLSAEREQGITIDVAYRYFATPRRKFIIGDAPGHEQYTRNMVTAATNADAALVLVDATKLKVGPKNEDQGQDKELTLLPQTRRHTLLAHLLQVPSIVFVVNKLDALDQADLAFAHIQNALLRFAQQAGIAVHAIVPISALHGQNVVHAASGFAGYTGPTLLDILEQLPALSQDEKVNASANAVANPSSIPSESGFALSVQWVEKFSSAATTDRGRRIFWGRIAQASMQVGQSVQVIPSGQSAQIVALLSSTRQDIKQASLGQSVGIVLDKEVDISRGDNLVSPGIFTPQTELTATLAWMDEAPLVTGRPYWALQGHRWIKAKIQSVDYCLAIDTLAQTQAHALGPNDIGRVRLTLQEGIIAAPYAKSRYLGALVLVDTATHRTCAAALLE
jgi:sulfate adenylyltransferase subunit 1